MHEYLLHNSQEAAILGSYALAFLLFYLSVAIIFYLVRASEIKTMSMIKDPKAMARNRKQIGVSIKLAEREKSMVLLWPVIIIKGFKRHVKKNTEKEK